MAISANTVWEVRPTNGADTNGGGFVSGASGTDFSQQNSKNTTGTNISTTDGVGAGTTTWVSATGNFTSALVGNIIYLAGSGITTGWYQVTAFTNSTTITLDRSPGTGTGATMNIGGALQTLTQLASNISNGHLSWVKAESTITVTTGINFSFTNSGTYGFIAGYTSTRGDNGQVTIQASSGSSYVMMTLNNNNNTNTMAILNFVFDCNSKSSVFGFSLQSNGTVIANMRVKNQTSGVAFNIENNGSANGTVRDCYVDSSCSGLSSGFQSTAANQMTSFIRCQVIGAGTTAGFTVSEGEWLINCIAANLSGATTDGFLVDTPQRSVSLYNCVAYNCGRHGINMNTLSAWPLTVENCILVLNGGYGLNVVSGPIPAGYPTVNFNFTYGNTSGAANGATITGWQNVTGSGDPFVNGSGGNFALNNTSGAGAACRGAGNPGVTQGGGTGYLDIGALQHQDSGGSAGMLFIPNLEGT